jgi:hypothetical protein
MRQRVVIAVLGAMVASSALAQQPRAKAGADPDKLEAAADNIARMKGAQKQVLTRAEAARNEKDVVKLNCVNEKLTQIKALIKVAEQANQSLRESVATSDQGGVADFSKIAIARTKVDRLRTESEACVGQLAYMVDERTTVEVVQPSGLPGSRGEGGLGVTNRGENPADSVGDIGNGGTQPPAPPPPIVIVRPPSASPSVP